MPARSVLPGMASIPRYVGLAILCLVSAWSTPSFPAANRAPSPPPSAELAKHLTSIAKLTAGSPTILIPEGPFLLGSVRVDDDPYGMGTQFDDTELPQHRVWMDAYEIDRDEISLGEYLSYLFAHKLHPSKDLQHLIWHVITVHSVTDETLAQWPALYVTWKEADSLCRPLGKRLPTEANGRKHAREPDGNRFPGGTPPDSTLAMFGQHHVHEIPILAPVSSGEAGKSYYGVHHMAGNVAEWVNDWFGFDYYAYMPERNPPGPTSGRYKYPSRGISNSLNRCTNGTAYSHRARL
ncbi:MAG: SUMF1/EgtB/PvdO family nonheme iron enzyme [Nitrospira sp.]|nr:SUMF1/EgtB/PvdO family nonheme iron enzyme [Nitrospira sp.]